MAAARPKPRLDDLNRAFWTGGAKGELKLFRCHDCGKFLHPPGPFCSSCLSENVGPETVAGTGVVSSYTVNHQAWLPGMDEPVVIAQIALDGVPGVLLTSNIVNCPVDEVDFGDRVRVVFEQLDDVYIPLFEKIA